jgi:hypothetical protein
LTVNTLKDSAGNSMVRKVGNIVHIGTNSFTIEDAATSASGKDEIASSINKLQIGTSTSHNTTVLGTLSVQTPTSDNHATTKAYVDTATGNNATSITSNSTNITSNTSSISTNSSNITSNANSISTNSASISTNSNDIISIKTKNTAQDSSITSNSSNVSSNTSIITTNTANISTNQSNISSNTNSISNNSSNITNNTNSIQSNQGLININIDKISEMETGLAQSMAMGALVQPQYGKSNFSIATGNYNGTNAIAYGFSHHDSDQDITYRLLGSQSNNISSSAASIGWGF